MLSITIFVLMFGGAFLTALLAASFYYAALYVRARRSGQEFVLEGADAGEAPGVLREDELSTIGVWSSLLARFGHVEELRKTIAEADLKWTVGRLTLMQLLGGSATATLLWQLDFVPLPAGVLITALVASAPYLYIRSLRRRRFRRFAAQFPEALDSLTRALKAGYPISAAMELLALEQPEPLASEMRRTREQWNLGTGWDHALDQLCDRVPLPEVAVFVAAVKMQNRAGGRLNDVLGRLGETMRENAALEGEIRAISAHSRITGLILTILPIVIGLLMFFVSPEYMAILLRREEGRTLLGAAALSNIAAHFIIKRIAQVKT